MKRFILFAGDRYYPNGGANDMINSFDAFDEAKNYFQNMKEELYWGWGNILDIQTGKITKL